MGDHSIPKDSEVWLVGLVKRFHSIGWSEQSTCPFRYWSSERPAQGNGVVQVNLKIIISLANVVFILTMRCRA